MTFDPDNPPLQSDAVLIPWRLILEVRTKWHKAIRAGLPVRPWAEVRAEAIENYLHG